METKYLDIHIIYSDKDKKYLPKLLQQYKKFKIENSIYNWELSLKVHNNSGINNIGQFQRRLEIKKALQDVVDEFGKETIINVLENYGDRVNSCHPMVKHLAYKYLTK